MAYHLFSLLILAQSTPQERGRWLGILIGLIIVSLVGYFFWRRNKR